MSKPAKKNTNKGHSKKRPKSTPRSSMRGKSASNSMVEVLNNAQQLIQSNKIKKSIDLLEPFEDEYPFADEDENYLNRYDSLLAYSYSQGKRFLESEKIIERGLKNSPDSADLLFTLTFVKLSMREYDLAREAGQR